MNKAMTRYQYIVTNRINMYTCSNPFSIYRNHSCSLVNKIY